MSYQAIVISVMIASPGDVAEERSIIQQIIYDWNALNTEARRMVLLPIAWETHSTPEMGGRPQAIINRQIVQKCDLLVAVFGTRIGSPTGLSQSGTVEEIREHLKLGKSTMIYFSDKPVKPDSIDRQQHEKLVSFREECRKTGLIERYESLDDFSEKFRRHLTKIVLEKFSEVQAPTQTRAPAGEPQLSEQAKQLLLAAVQGDGEIFCLPMGGGLRVVANKRNFLTEDSPRERAKWTGAISELTKHGFAESQGSKQEMFCLTDAGFRIADSLAAIVSGQETSLRLVPFFRSNVIGFSLANVGQKDVELIEIECAIPKTIIDPNWPRISADSSVLRYSVRSRESLEYVIGTYSAGILPTRPNSGLDLLPKVFSPGMKRDELRPFYFPIKRLADSAEREIVYYKAFIKGRPPLEEKMSLAEIIREHTRAA